MLYLSLWSTRVSRASLAAALTQHRTSGLALYGHLGFVTSPSEEYATIGTSPVVLLSLSKQGLATPSYAMDEPALTYSKALELMPGLASCHQHTCDLSGSQCLLLLKLALLLN